MRAADWRSPFIHTHRAEIMIEHDNRRQGSVASTVSEVIVGGLQLAVECFGWVIELGVSLLVGILRG
jgi:hypothetical protein